MNSDYNIYFLRFLLLILFMKHLLLQGNFIYIKNKKAKNNNPFIR